MSSSGELSSGLTDEWRAESLRGAEGFFRVGRAANDRWWLIDPTGRPFFCKAVHGVQKPPGADQVPVPPDPASRLRAWGFNAVGLGDGTGREEGFPFVESVEFCDAGHVIAGPGVRLPDVFDPEWAAWSAKHAAQLCPPLRNERALLGWVSDAGLQWAPPGSEGRPSLLQICLSAEPRYAAYHAAWEFVLALHRGSLEGLARAWGVPIANKEVVREFTRAERGFATRGYLRDDLRWTREFARRYFATTSAAIRAVDPHHLLLGCRGPSRAGSAVLAECAHPAVDIAMPSWTDLPANGPVLADNVCWAEPAIFNPLTGGKGVRRLTAVERMLRRGRVALERLAKHPGVVGYFWPQWHDDLSDQPPFGRGLVHINAVEAREHTELLTLFNARAEALRHKAALVPAAP